MQPLADNRELYKYLLELSAQLKERGSEELSEAVAFAARHAVGMSTEFLGESRIALRRVSAQAGDALTDEARVKLTGVLRQLDQAFDRRGTF